MSSSFVSLPLDRGDPVRRARWSVSAVFFANGIVVGAWAPHIPLLKARLALGDGALGAALLATGIGALVAMPLAGRFVARVGSATATRWATASLIAAFLTPIVAPNFALLTVALFFFGFSNGLLDVVMNAHGVLVERRFGRPIMSSLHAFFSLGGLTGAALGGLSLAHVEPRLQAVVLVVDLALVAVFALRGLLGDEDRGVGAGPAFALPDSRTLGLGLLTFAAFVAEGAMLDWTGVYLAGTLGTTAAFGAAGYAAFSAAMTVGRFSGDRIRARLSAVSLVRISGLLAAVGLGFGLAVATPWSAIAGFTLAGFGLSNLVPVFFGAGGRAESGSGHGIAAVATLGYFGFLAGPPVIGFAAELLGLGAALGLVVLGCAAIVVFAGIASHADD